MENPEEILHSLEEFAKMKPKDIPRELEEYLKFVAKTGDPVYQWSAIKSLFREKLINVITEFYESCSSMEIPPCPNVEMFNYDLMKNFILEKLDTFASAPFTLQRICELLTSPRKEYTRIDKYMRALEKNILVVSTMEPGGRRTENGDGVMNGIESDHEHVPEPGNEINVEEMDDSPSWPQNIQTNNHIAEPISFENQEHEYHVSSTNQEIVCVQYVSVEPLASEGLQIPNEEVKESDISVTITALNVKKDNEKPEELTSEIGNEPAIDISQETSEAVDKQENDKTETDTNMDLQVGETSENVVKDNSTYNSDSVSSNSPSEDTLSTTTLEKPEESNQLQAISLESENAESENISPETSLTSENLIQSNVSSTAVCNEDNLENTNISVCPLEVSEASEISHEIKEDAQILETDSPGDIDSSIKVSDDDDVNADHIKISSISEESIPKLQSKEDPPFIEETEKSEVVSSPACDVTFETDISKVSEESPKVESPMEVTTPQEQFNTAEVIPDDISKPTELDDPSSEVPAEPDLISEEKETVMEVSDIPEDTVDPIKKDKPVLEELKISDPPV